jgi:hypothetical protein
LMANVAKLDERHPGGFIPANTTPIIKPTEQAAQGAVPAAQAVPPRIGRANGDDELDLREGDIVEIADASDHGKFVFKSWGHQSLHHRYAILAPVRFPDDTHDTMVRADRLIVVARRKDI